MRAPLNPTPKARIIGPGLVVTLEHPASGMRLRARIALREGARVHLLPLSADLTPSEWRPGAPILLRAARSFGLFIYKTRFDGASPDGAMILSLREGRPQRRQLRGYFRMPVRLSVMLESDLGDPIVIMRARNLSGSGILLFDPESKLALQTTVRLGLPVGNSGELLRLPARVVRVSASPTRLAALTFDGISEGARQMLLRYLVRQHRKRQLQGKRNGASPARIMPIERP